MVNQITGSFQCIRVIQEKLLGLCDQRMELLKAHQLKEAEHLHKQEMLLLFDLEQELKGLSEVIRVVSEQHHLPSARLTPLLDCLPFAEKEAIVEAKEAVFQLEKTLNNKLKLAQHMVQTKMVVPEIIRQNLIAHQKETGSEGSGIINRKY